MYRFVSTVPVCGLPCYLPPLFFRNSATHSGMVSHGDGFGFPVNLTGHLFHQGKIRGKYPLSVGDIPNIFRQAFFDFCDQPGRHSETGNNSSLFIFHSPFGPTSDGLLWFNAGNVPAPVT
jgi:hypothetical protein